MEGINNLFFDIDHPTENFKSLAEKVKLEHVGKLAIFYRSLNYDIPERKERIDGFTARLEKRIGEDVTKRLEELKKQFEDSVERDMKMMVAKALTSCFGLNFYGELTRLYFQKKAELLTDFNKQLMWVRGSSGSANELDDVELAMVETLKGETKSTLDRSMLEKLCDYFRENFYYDQHKIKYDYNSLNDQKAVEIFVTLPSLSPKPRKWPSSSSATSTISGLSRNAALR